MYWNVSDKCRFQALPEPCNAHVHSDLMLAIFMVIDILINNHTPGSIQFNKFVPVMRTIESVMHGSVHQSTIRVIRHEISPNIAHGEMFRCHRTCHICSIAASRCTDISLSLIRLERNVFIVALIQ